MGHDSNMDNVDTYIDHLYRFSQLVFLWGRISTRETQDTFFLLQRGNIATTCLETLCTAPSREVGRVPRLEWDARSMVK